MPSPEASHQEDIDAVDKLDKPDQPKQADTGNIDKNKLTANEVKQLNDGKISIKDIANQRLQYESEAKREINQMVTVKNDGESTINLNEYKEFKKEIDETESPEKLKELIDRLKELPKKKEQQKAQEKEDLKELDPDNPKLLKLQNSFNSICEKNSHLIGTKQVPGFKAWFTEQRREKPTVAHLKELIDRLEGKKITDKNGLAPRRDEFNALTSIFNKYNLKPLNNRYIAQEGLSERKEFRKNAEKLDETFRKLISTGFYSNNCVKQIMQSCLKAKNPHQQNQLINQINNISRKEAEGFTYFDSKITIENTTIRKMSEASKKLFLEYYKDCHDLNERSDMVQDWKELIENEADLAKELAKVYKDDKDSLKLALQSFEDLDFVSKKKEIENHKTLVKNEKTKEELQKKLVIKAAHSKIDEAASKNIMSASTQKEYKEWYEKPSSFKNEETKKEGDLQKMKDAFEFLTSSTPKAEGEARNISAYEIKRKRFQKELKELKEINPNIKDSELNSWQERYDHEGWTPRKKVYKQMKKEIEKQKLEKAKQRELEEEVDLKKEDKEKVKKSSLELNETISKANELIEDNQAAEAMKLLLAYNEKDPDNPKILFWIDTAARYMKEFGSGKKVEEDKTEKQLDEQVDKALKEDEVIKEQLDEENLINLNLDGAEQAENRFDQVSSAQERGRKESLSKSQDGSLQHDLIEDYYEQTDQDHILNEDLTGEKITEVDFNDVSMSKEDRQSLKDRTREKQGRLIDKSGLNVKLKDKTGRQITSDEARVVQKENLEKLEDDVAEKAIKKAKSKSIKESTGSNVYDLNARIAAKRKAKEKIEEQIKSQDILAA